jgi:AcrR family transcriptional regulator
MTEESAGESIEESPAEPTSARQRMLDAVLAHVAEHGLGDTSLRTLAEQIGTSHRMLIYHFRSKDELKIAVVAEVERRQREAFLGLADAESAEDFLRTGMELWDRLADPALAPFERLFFEVYAQALHGRPWAANFLPGAVTDWLDTLTPLFASQQAVADRQPDGTATSDADQPDPRHLARLALAVARGLLLDLLATGDRDGVTAALRAFLPLFAPPD